MSKTVVFQPTSNNIDKYLPGEKMEAIQAYINSNDNEATSKEIERIADTLGVSVESLTAALFYMVYDLGRVTNPASKFRSPGNVTCWGKGIEGDHLDTQQTYHGICGILTGLHRDTLQKDGTLKILGQKPNHIDGKPTS